MFDIFSEKRLIFENDGKVEILENIFEHNDSLLIFKELAEKISWKQEYIELFGKRHPVPRLSAWYGDKGLSYTYSNITMNPNEWNPLLLKIKKTIETKSNHNFNSVLLNYYRDGKDYAAWHSDNEKELGRNPVIASLSLGEERSFHLKHKKNKGVEVCKIILPHNSLLLMSGNLQHCWNHQLAKTTKKINGRINLTFRSIIK